MADSSPLSGVNVVLVMAYGSLASHRFICHPQWCGSTRKTLLRLVTVLFIIAGVCAAVHLRQKANHAFCNEIPPRTSCSYRPQCTKGKSCVPSRQWTLNFTLYPFYFSGLKGRDWLQAVQGPRDSFWASSLVRSGWPTQAGITDQSVTVHASYFIAMSV